MSDDDAPERFYHGFVLGLMVKLDGRFEIGVSPMSDWVLMMRSKEA